MKIILINIATFLFSAFPLSLILIIYLQRILSRYNPRLGDTTSICINITGTLTEDNLIVRTFYYDRFKGKIKDNSKFIRIEEEDKDSILIEKHELLKDDTFRLIAITNFLCTYKKTAKPDKIIRHLMMECGFSKHKTEDDYKTIQHLKTSEEKKVSTIIAIKNSTKEIFSFSKGNAYSLIKKCAKYIQHGKKLELSDTQRRKLRKQVKQLNKNGQKVIAFAYKPLPLKRQDNYTEAFSETEMTFLGIFGVTNPLKENLEEPINQIKELEIKPYILTRVKERKATAIGQIHKLINPQYFEAVTGEYLRALPDLKIEKMLSNKEKDYVFAELKKEDKKRIIRILQKQGETVASIDKKQNLPHIVNGIRKGRLAAKNYPKFAHHAISAKLAELIILVSALLLGAPAPLTILLIISADILINFILELSLRIGKPEEETVPPSTISLLTTGVSMGILLSLTYLSTIFRYGWNFGESIPSSSPAHAIATTTTIALLVIIQIINAFSLRSRTKSFFSTSLWQNPFLLLTSLIVLLISYAIMTIPVISEFLKLRMISSIEWQIIGYAAIIFFILEEVRKFLLRKYANSQKRISED